MTEEHDVKEFVDVIVEDGKMMLDLIEITKDAWITVLDNDRDHSTVIDAAEKTRVEVIGGTYPRVLSAFMQPPEEEAEVKSSTLADQLTEQEQTQPTRAGRGQKG